MMDKKQKQFRWNGGTGMVTGILIGALIALIVSTFTGDQSIWNWAIPVGLAAGLAIGTGWERRSRSEPGN